MSGFVWSNNWWLRHDGQSIFRVILACGRILYQSFRVQLVPYLHRHNNNDHWISVFNCFILFSKIRLGQTSSYMKYMPVSFLFSAAHDSFSNMCSFIETLVFYHFYNTPSLYLTLMIY